MSHDPDLLNAIRGYEAHAWRGRAFRHMLGDYPPQRPNVRGARWNPPEVAALYASLERETAIAEGDHRLSLEPVPIRLGRTLYEVELSLASLVDLTVEGLLSELGLGPDEMRSDDLRACQEVGGVVARLGRDGLLVPSLRHQGTNLVVFTDNQPPGVGFRILSRR